MAKAQTQTRVAREGLDELIGRLLADEAQGILQQGLARRYERRTEALPVLRGRPAPRTAWLSTGGGGPVLAEGRAVPSARP